MFYRIKNNSVIIDVRDKQEHLSSSKNIIDKTINIPLNKLKKDIKKLHLNKDAEIYTFCESGKRSKLANQILKQMGYTNVHDLVSAYDVEFFLK